MERKKILTIIIITAISLILPFVAIGEILSRDIESNGRIKETVWTDDNGQPAAGPEGYVSVRYSYKGGDTIEQYYDAEGKPYSVSGGYFGKRTERDGKNRVTAIEYLDQNGQRTENLEGYAQVTIAYTSFGEVRQVSYTNQSKKLVIVPSLGYASVVTEFSGKIMTGRTYKDTKGNPVDNRDGYAVMKQKLNKKYQVLSIRYDHADGSPAIGPDGWFRCVKDWDNNGRLISVKYYDTNMNLTDRGAGYAWEGYTYEGDSTVKSIRYDVNNEPLADEAGIVTTIRIMNDAHVTKESFLDRDGKRISNILGAVEILYSYDPQGSLESVSYRDADGNPVICSKGYAGYRDTKDDEGSTISRTFLGTDGLAMETPGGYSEIRYEYDETKQIISIRYFDLNGKQIQTQ